MNRYRIAFLDDGHVRFDVIQAERMVPDPQSWDVTFWVDNENVGVVKDALYVRKLDDECKCHPHGRIYPVSNERMAELRDLAEKAVALSGCLWPITESQRQRQQNINGEFFVMAKDIIPDLISFILRDRESRHCCKDTIGPLK